MNTILFWFRRDLRLVDNVGLSEARNRADRLLTIFLVDPTHSNWPHRCGDRLAFKLECVNSLRERITDSGGTLLIQQGKPEQVLPPLCEKENVDGVVWNRSYEPYERQRDSAAKEALEKSDVSVETFKDQVIFEKREILTNSGDPYQVFTHYANKWKSRPKPDCRDPVTELDAPRSQPPGKISSVEELGLSRSLTEVEWGPNRQSALEQWENFVSGNISTYEEDRNYPAKNGTSRISPYLRFGLVSVREIVRGCQRKIKKEDETSVDSIETFIEEIIWRDFYQQILYSFPRVVEDNFKSKYDDLDWNDDEVWFDAWKAGRTGFPIVDAAMRQLNQTGWMHNRLRMIVASFLTKDCLIHWKHGEQYFMNRLIDGDTASNNGGWQWAASTGTDAVPYFRIFNPITQSKKYDPSGEFIRRYCPELSDLNDESIHAPFHCDESQLQAADVQLGTDYPEPILDHSVRREIALERFKSVDRE